MRIKAKKEENPSDVALTEFQIAIRKAREELGLSYAKLGELVGMDRGGVHHVLHSKQNLTIQMMVRLARGVGLKLSFELSAQ